MKQTFIEFLQQYVSADEAEQITSHADIIELPTRHVLIHQGDMAEHVYFVVHGLCHACYLTPEGKQFSKEFYWEKDFIIGFEGLVKQQPSPYLLESLTPTVLLSLPITQLQQWRAEQHPLYFQLLETQLMYKENKERFMLLHSPEERYQLFCQSFPDLKTRLADYQIASYLGITSISLSRIKKRLED